MVYFVSGLRRVRRRVPFLRTREDENDILRSLLAGYVRDGNALMAETSALTNELKELASVEERALAWVKNVHAELDRHRPGWGDLFLDDTYGVQYMSQYGERDKLRNWLQRRLTKLGDLVRQL